MKVSSFLRSFLVVMVLSIVVTDAHAQGASGSDDKTLPRAGEHKAWKKDHPRRTEVNKRLGSQRKRIHEGVKKGTLTKEEAGQLRSEDKQIRTEEKSFALENGGHITKAEKKDLNQQENNLSKQIYEEKHDSNSTK